MAGVSVGDGGGGKKSVDHEIPLIPFIDLLLCCVMFLLATAVWNQVARINANQKAPGKPEEAPTEPIEEKVRLFLQIENSGFVIASSAGDRIPIPKVGDKYNLDDLRVKLQDRKRLEPNRNDIIVSPEDGIRYEDIVAAMDVAVGEEYRSISLQGGETL